VVAPGPHRVLVAPERQGQQLARIGQALEPLDRDEAIDVREVGAQGGGQPEIIVFAPFGGPDLENDGDHSHPPPRAAWRDRPSTGSQRRPPPDPPPPPPPLP